MEVKEKEMAPDFEAKIQDGSTVKLSDYKGKKVVLYFYPKDDTPGCTTQACNLRDNYEDLTSKGYVVIGVSPDNEQSHQKFIDKYSLPFILITDTSKHIHNLYGTWGENRMFGKKYMGTLRHTFVIDEEGKIQKIIKKVETKSHVNQILAE